MTTSISRTIVLPASPVGWQSYDGVFPQANPAESLDYSVDTTAPMQDAGDYLQSISLTVQPSGSGELVASDLTVSGYVITFDLAGGVAGRTPPYAIEIVATGMSGRRWQWVLELAV